MLVYIASLPHSGSTLLSLLLGKHPRVVALGEVRLQIGKIRRDPGKAGEGMCGCGAKIADCPVWGRFIAECGQPRGPVRDLQVVARIMRDLDGPEPVFVDASKIREPLAELAHDGSLRVKVLHLSRDYRSWIVSAADLRRRKGKRARARWLSGFQGAYRWVRENRKLDRTIAASGFPCMRVGYEELVLDAERVWPLLWEFLGLPATAVPRNVSGSRNHIFSGNRMREDAERRAVTYDGRWLSSREWRPVSLLVPQLSAANRRWAYSHGFGGNGDKKTIIKLAAAVRPPGNLCASTHSTSPS